MAYSPVINVPQYHVDGVPASGYVMKAYIAGTSTLLQMATAADGLTLVNTMTLNSQGYPTVSGNIVVPHLNAAYKLALYPSQAAADANSGAIWIPDALTPASIVANIDFSGNTISSTNTNGNIIIDPNGSGEIQLAGPSTATTLTAQTVNSSTVDATTLEINNVAVTATAAELNVMDDSAQAVANYQTYKRVFLQSDGAGPSAFDVDSNITESTWESVGPTGSGATNIYTGMDAIPAGATFAVFLANLLATSSGAGIVVISLYARAAGSASSVSNSSLAARFQFDPDAAETMGDSRLIFVPINASKVCEFQYVTLNTSSDDIEVSYRGYCI